MSLPAILQQLKTASPAAANLSQIKNLVNTMKNIGNPQALMQQMMSQKNPHLQQAINYVQQCGGDPKAAFEKLAAEKGIDPAEIEQMFK